MAQFEDGVRGWLAAAAPGDGLLYYAGNLGRDRREDPAADAHARVLLWAESESLVLLTQQRLGIDSYHYWAHRTAVPCAKLPEQIPSLLEVA